MDDLEDQVVPPKKKGKKGTLSNILKHVINQRQGSNQNHQQ
jgi:hypothetical protein